MIVYLSKGELKNFFDSNEETMTGFSFEWEGEDVVHLHPVRPLHGYGVEGRCLFSREAVAKASTADAVSFIVEAASESKVKCFRRNGASWEEVALSFIPSIGRSSTGLQRFAQQPRVMFSGGCAF